MYKNQSGNQVELTKLEVAVGCEVHPFSSTLGPGPYKYIGMGFNVKGKGFNGPACEQVEGHCYHCNTRIVYVYVVETGEGRRFGVGCDCIMEVANQAGFMNIDEVQRQMRKIKNEQAKARKVRQIASLTAEILATAELNKAKLEMISSKNNPTKMWVSSFYANAYECVTRTVRNNSLTNLKRIKQRLAIWLA